MRRRRFVQALIAVPAAPGLMAQRPAGRDGAPPEAQPVLQLVTADDAADAIAGFFDDRQFATLSRLSELLMPAQEGGVSAIEAGAPEFLDFLLGESPPDRQQLYLNGLDTLEYQSRTRFNKAFAEASDDEAGQLLAPLRQRWNYEAPDTLTAFLREAKSDVRTATVNSRPWSAAAGRPNTGRYWLPVE